MDEKTLYKETFSCIRSRTEVRIEDFAGHRRSKFGRKLLLIAAVVSILAALGVTAYAADFVGLRSFILREPVSKGAHMDATPVTDFEESLNPVKDWSGATLSVQGYADSPESLAMAEWLKFQAGYDTDGSILASVGNGPTGLDEKYDLYSAYDQVMADKLDEIVEKYGLKLHTNLYDMPSEDCPSYTDGEFLNGNHMRYWGYIYEDGSFHYDGDYFAPDVGMITYQLERHVAGSLSDVSLNIGDPADYKEWQYDSNGTTVLLAYSINKSLVMADLDGVFVFVNILNDPTMDFTDSDLETFADSIDWLSLGEIYNLQKLKNS